MRDLGDVSALRRGWDEVEAFESAMMRPTTAVQRVRQFLDLRRTFAQQLSETASLFQGDHEQALVALQERLRRASGALDG